MNNPLARYQRQKRCKKRFDSDEEETEVIIEEENNLSSPVKLKIKIEPKGITRAVNADAVSDEKVKGKRKKKEGESSSEEERWLDAIESGNLHEVDEELKHIQGRKGMTARQRSLLERKAEKLSGRPKEKRASAPAEEITEEMKHKKALKTQKRREQAHQKREKDKKQTLDKLLKKQDVKQTKTGKAKTASAAAASKNKAMISYRDSLEGITLSYPINVPFPIVKQIANPPPPLVLCGVTGCKNPKKYACSKSGVSLCSLQCYKRNLEAAVT